MQFMQTSWGKLHRPSIHHSEDKTKASLGIINDYYRWLENDTLLVGDAEGRNNGGGYETMVYGLNIQFKK